LGGVGHIGGADPARFCLRGVTFGELYGPAAAAAAAGASGAVPGFPERLACNSWSWYPNLRDNELASKLRSTSSLCRRVGWFAPSFLPSSCGAATAWRRRQCRGVRERERGWAR